MKVIGYVRVSTDEQGNDDRFSLPHQREHIEQECNARGWHLLHIYEDTESGKSTKKRIGFNTAMDMMNTADVLVVHELDRLSRNIIDTLIIVDNLNKVGKKFFSIHDNIDSSSEQGELQLHILAVFAHYFRKQLGRKVHGSMLTRAEAGLYNTKPPVGYKLIDKRLTINEDEAWIVKKIFDLYLENNGFRSIADYFNTMGIKTRQGAAWSTFPIKRILTNQVYIGSTVWNVNKRVDTKDVKRPEEEWIVAENTHEPIIEKEAFRQVQERMNRKGKIGGRAQDSIYLLGGILRCGYCGSPMTGNTATGRVSKKTGERKKYPRYMCSAYHKQNLCQYIAATKDEIEKAVLDYIKNFIGSPKEAALLQKKKESDVVGLNSEHRKLTSELNNLKIKSKRQLEAFEVGAIDIHELKEAKERIRHQEESIKKELDKIESSLKSVDQSEHIKKKMSDFYQVFKSKDIKLQKAWLQQHVKEIIYKKNDDVEIVFNA